MERCIEQCMLIEIYIASLVRIFKSILNYTFLQTWTSAEALNLILQFWQSSINLELVHLLQRWPLVCTYVKKTNGLLQSALSIIKDNWQQNCAAVKKHLHNARVNVFSKSGDLCWWVGVDKALASVSFRLLLSSFLGLAVWHFGIQHVLIRAAESVGLSPILSWPRIIFSERVC